MQIVGTVPSLCLHGILAKVARHHEYGPSTYVYPPVHSLHPDAKQLAHLVSLLPRSFHPAILLACCRCEDAEGGTSLSIPLMPPCNETCPQQCRRCGPGCASALFQLVAAAAALAGGSVERAWAPDGVAQLLASNVSGGCIPSSAAQDNCAPRTPQDEQQTKQMAPPLTKLVLVVSGVTLVRIGDAPPTPESPRWCAALAELRTLRVLSVQSVNAARLRPRELAAALQRLPGLHDLSLTCDRPSEEQLGSALFSSMAHLVSRIAGMTQLSALALVNCLYCGPSCEGSRDVVPDHYVPMPEVAQLSRLAGLTSLSVCTEVMGYAGNDMLIRAVKQMSALRALHVQQDIKLGEIHIGGKLASQLLAAKELTAFHSLSFPRLSLYLGDAFNLADFHQRLRTNSSLKNRLSALDLSGCAIECAQKDILAGVLADLPALSLLRLGDNGFGDAALVFLAPTFARMSKLSALALDRNDASDVGVFAVMKAVADAVGARHGGVGLRELDISGNEIGPEHAAELAALLGKLQDIEVFNMSFVGIFGRDLLPVVKAAEGLPRLRSLGMFGRVRMFSRDRIGDLLDGLGHVSLS